MNPNLSRAKLLQATFANWHFDHTVNRSVIGEYSFSPEGINRVSALYLSNDVALPVALHLVLKTELFTDPKTGKERWLGMKRSFFQKPCHQKRNCSDDGCLIRKETDNFPLCFSRYLVAQMPFRGHFAISSASNMNFIKNKAKKDFIIPLKTNRNVFLAEPSAKLGKSVKLSSLDFDTNPLHTLWLEEVDFPLLVSRQIAQSCLEQLSPFQKRKWQ